MINQTKTRVCKLPDEKFDFLGYTFRARRSKNRWGKYFVNFSPGVSNAATKAIRQRLRDWQFGCRIDKWIDDLARMFNPVIRGWMNYYGRYYKSALYPTLRYLNRCLARWAMAKYNRRSHGINGRQSTGSGRFPYAIPRPDLGGGGGATPLLYSTGSCRVAQPPCYIE